MENEKVPVQIQRSEQDGLYITWEVGDSQVLVSAEALRRSCPCAACKEARGEGNHDQPLSPKKKTSLQVISHTREEELSLKEIWPIGNYALGLRWADGHDDGIYTFSLLHELSSERKKQSPTNGDL